MLYAGDHAWWKAHEGCPEFGGLKFSAAFRTGQEPWGVRVMRCNQGRRTLVADRTDEIGWGYCSGFGGINLAAHARPAKVILVGYDLSLDHGVHWHGLHGGRLNNPQPNNLAKWRGTIDGAAAALAALSIEVINASPVSTLKNYPKMSFEEAMEA